MVPSSGKVDNSACLRKWPVCMPMSDDVRKAEEGQGTKLQEYAFTQDHDCGEEDSSTRSKFKQAQCRSEISEANVAKISTAFGW